MKWLFCSRPFAHVVRSIGWFVSRMRSTKPNVTTPTSAPTATCSRNGRRNGDVLEDELTQDMVNLIAWRVKNLTKVGVDSDVAGQLAAIPDLDLWRAVDLKEQGCPQKLMLAILS